jgi:uncharacterized cupin superfamily protein
LNRNLDYTIKIEIKKLSDVELTALNVYSWPIWSCEVSEFPWTYNDKETCFILEGKVIVTTDHEEVTIESGDFVVFSKGLSCRWRVLKPIRKYYSFG